MSSVKVQINSQCTKALLTLPAIGLKAGMEFMPPEKFFVAGTTLSIHQVLEEGDSFTKVLSLIKADWIQPSLRPKPKVQPAVHRVPVGSNGRGAITPPAMRDHLDMLQGKSEEDSESSALVVGGNGRNEEDIALVDNDPRLQALSDDEIDRIAMNVNQNRHDTSVNGQLAQRRSHRYQGRGQSAQPSFEPGVMPPPQGHGQNLHENVQSILAQPQQNASGLTQAELASMRGGKTIDTGDHVVRRPMRRSELRNRR